MDKDRQTDLSEASPSPCVIPLTHDFHHSAVDAINDSPRQRAFRKLAPMPYGSVLIARDDMDEACIRWHLRKMRELGFNSIKQFVACKRWPTASLEALALEEGLTPWWYGEGGWEPISQTLCEQLGIKPDQPLSALRSHPSMIEHQGRILAQRLGRRSFRLNNGAALKTAESTEALSPDASLPETVFEDFRDWLRQHYNNDINALNQAWNCDGSYAGDPSSGYASFEDIPYAAASSIREYRRIRDILRFKADHRNSSVLATCQKALQRDAYEPYRAGGEMGLFLPFASRGIDMEGIARSLKDGGSFYPSIHLCWHFEETFFEVARPVFMQASFVVDLNKGGWTAPWESTGGPQQTSGAKAELFPQVADRQPGYTVHAGTMTQLQLSYLAAGCRGSGIWSWNARMAGFEAGEYALLDRNEQVCERTRRVGAIAKAANQLRDELWAARKEPQVGIFLDWDNEACWAAMAQVGRDLFKHCPIEGRIGASRACMDASIPFEYVTANNIRAGLALRYPILYLPTVIALSQDLMPFFLDYVKNGGRLVMDLPGGCYDQNGRVLCTQQGSAFAQLFGVELADLHYSGTNCIWHLHGLEISGYTADLNLLDAEALAYYERGAVAACEKKHGAGTAVLLGWEAARACYRPGNQAWQQHLVQVLLNGTSPFYQINGGPLAYRLAAPQADHYFLINEGPERSASFSILPRHYGSCQDVLTGETINITGPLKVESDGGRWLRCLHALES